MNGYATVLIAKEREGKMILNLVEYKEKKRQKKEQAIYRNIEEDISHFEDAVDLITALPFPAQVRLVKYCLTHLVTLHDLSVKQEDNV